MGRKRIYLDDADRAAAYRERRANHATLADMCLTIVNKPTLALVTHCARLIAERAEDKALAGAQVAEAMLAGLAQGGGGNCADAARNFVRYETTP